MQAMKSEHAPYWRDAIDVEWNGIMANDTLDFVKRKTMPHGSNLMNSQFVFMTSSHFLMVQLKNSRLVLSPMEIRSAMVLISIKYLRLS